jgi:hypothetical protein
MAKKLKLSGKFKKILTTTVICVWEVNDGCSSPPKVFMGQDEKKVVKAAEEHFECLLKEHNPDIAEGSTIEDVVSESLDMGNYDDGNGYEIVLSWPSVVNV